MGEPSTNARSSARAMTLSPTPSGKPSRVISRMRIRVGVISTGVMAPIREVTTSIWETWERWELLLQHQHRFRDSRPMSTPTLVRHYGYPTALITRQPTGRISGRSSYRTAISSGTSRGMTGRGSRTITRLLKAANNYASQAPWTSGLQAMWGPAGTYTAMNSGNYGGLGYQWLGYNAGAVLRGGYWVFGSFSGVFYAYLSFGPSFSYYVVGFRCAWGAP